MRYRASHVTRYLYSEPVSMCHTEVHLTSRQCANQTVLEYELNVDPEPDSVMSREDYFGNEVTSFSIEQPHRELVITSQTLVDLAPPQSVNLALSPPWEEVRSEVARVANKRAFEASEYTFPSPMISVGPPFAAYAAPSFPPGRRFLEGVEDLSRRIHAEFRYDPRATTVTTAVAEVLAARHGVCQDFAHLMISCLRSLGLPARYISGYVHTHGTLVGGDASHAWVSVWCPMFGWQDVDPTNNAMPPSEHITLAWGREYSDVTPIKGVALGGGDQIIHVSVDVAAA